MRFRPLPHFLTLWCCFTISFALTLASARAADASATQEIRIVELQGTVEIATAGSSAWTAAGTNQVLRPTDRIRTGANSRTALRWSDQSVIPFGALTELEILPPHETGAQSGLRLVRGVLSFFHKDRPGRIRIVTRGAVAGVEGTEFILAVEPLPADGERTTLSVIDGRVSFGNDLGSLVLTNGEQAVVTLGQAPVRTAGFIAENLLQWAFYYPAVLNPDELPLTAGEQAALAESLAAYRAGALQAALAAFPARGPASDAERLYHAALLLGVGEVRGVEEHLAALTETDPASTTLRLAAALRRLIAAVKNQPAPAVDDARLATEFLADSYHLQSRAVPDESLEAALAAARRAAELAPELGFAWTRVAELEFSFGRTRESLAALEKSLALSPRNAQALSLKGFLLAAQNRTHEAIPWFDRAIAADNALGNAWLGRGLCRVRRGDLAGGREDLLIAAALEPRRAELRHYLGKVLADSGQPALAATEVRLAKELDPADPGSWFYSALLHHQQNRINPAIRDLEEAQRLNANRGVYRSSVLLDQDQAVRGVNLARIYADAGMANVAQREAAIAVNTDYLNYSAHRFLGDSYNWDVRNLPSHRYETATTAEYRMANLLAPVNAGLLSPALSQAEYSGLLERNRMGAYASTEYLSRGAWEISGGQYGVFDTFSYDLNGTYVSDPGEYPYNDLTLRGFEASFKQQITPRDVLYLNINTLNMDSGIRAAVYEIPQPGPTVILGRPRIEQTQEPNLSVGYRHEWSPGVQTLVYLSRLDSSFSYTNNTIPALMTVHYGPEDPLGPMEALFFFTAHGRTTMDSEIYSAEMQHIWQRDDWTTLVGGRFQFGQVEATSRQIFPDSGFLHAVYPMNHAFGISSVETDFRRASGYAYQHWQILDHLWLIGGLTYDRIHYSDTVRTPPVTDTQETKDQFSPKAGLIWTPRPDTVVRFAHTRSLSGMERDQSVQMEPSQVAGFTQLFRAIAPGAVTGPLHGGRFETLGLSLERKFQTGTYLALSGEILTSKHNRSVPIYEYLIEALDFPYDASTRQRLDFRERAVALSVNQLLGDEWSVGATYRLSHAVLKSDLLEAGEEVFITDRINDVENNQALLHNLNLFALYNHPSGFFAGVEGLWFSQDNDGYNPGRDGDRFWHCNLHVGYRLPRKRAEVSVGLLNLTDRDYRLNPLNTTDVMPRERTLAVRFQVGF